MKLQNSNILITGGTRGIGKETARILKEKGANVAITARDLGELEAVSAELDVYAIQSDVGTPHGVTLTYESFFSKYDKLDVLINNAGIGGRARLEDLDIEEMKKIYETNVFGATMMGQKAAEVFKKQNYGNIINIGSTAALRGYEGGSMYVSSKFALRGLTECWKAELRKNNVRVFLVNPSEVRTSFGTPDNVQKEEVPNKLRGEDIGLVIASLLEMDDRGFVPELSVWATNPW